MLSLPLSKLYNYWPLHDVEMAVTVATYLLGCIVVLTKTCGHPGCSRPSGIVEPASE